MRKKFKELKASIPNAEEIKLFADRKTGEIRKNDSVLDIINNTQSKKIRPKKVTRRLSEFYMESSPHRSSYLDTLPNKKDQNFIQRNQAYIQNKQKNVLKIKNKLNKEKNEKKKEKIKSKTKEKFSQKLQNEIPLHLRIQEIISIKNLKLKYLKKLNSESDINVSNNMKVFDKETNKKWMKNLEDWNAKKIKKIKRLREERYNISIDNVKANNSSFGTIAINKAKSCDVSFNEKYSKMINTRNERKNKLFNSFYSKFKHSPIINSSFPKTITSKPSFINSNAPLLIKKQKRKVEKKVSVEKIKEKTIKREEIKKEDFVVLNRRISTDFDEFDYRFFNLNLFDNKNKEEIQDKNELIYKININNSSAWDNNKENHVYVTKNKFRRLAKSLL